ncbi:MAG: hypothetical protein DMG83_06200 [Acidobacteria bacterium]|nr:MAG: hypothetical protein DMG83_06200 [Acidobacteriota bacterium]
MIALLRSEITRRLERRPLKRRFSRPVTKAAFRVNSEELAGSQEVDFSAAAVLRRMGEAAVRRIDGRVLSTILGTNRKKAERWTVVRSN